MISWLNVKHFVVVHMARLLLPAAMLAQVGHAETAVYEAFGDAEKGRQLSGTCESCHGKAGKSQVPNFPKLAGQVDKYTYKQLKDMEAGIRNVPEMVAFVANLSDQDMKDLAAYYAEQSTTFESVAEAYVALGGQIYAAGIKGQGVPACSACHGAQGKGVQAAGFPALSGQYAQYIEATLKAYRVAGRGDQEGKRRENDGDTKIMRTITAKMTDEQIKAVSEYISGLH